MPTEDLIEAISHHCYATLSSSKKQMLNDVIFTLFTGKTLSIRIIHDEKFT